MKRHLHLSILSGLTALLILAAPACPARASSVDEMGFLPQEDCWTQATPSVVWAGDPASATTIEAHFVNRKDVKRAWVENRGSTVEEEPIELYDDGTHGDKKAGDMVFTCSGNVLTFAYQQARLRHGYLLWIGTVQAELTDGTRLICRDMNVAMVDPKFKGEFPVTDFGSGMSATPYAFFIQDSGNKVIDSYPVSNVYCGTKNYDAYKKLYSVYPDLFDFAMMMPGMQIFRPKDLGENVPYDVLVSNSVQHIGLPLINNAKSFGSAGRLKSVQFASFGCIQIQDHEMGHTWGMNLGEKLGLMEKVAGTTQLGHWNHLADIGGQMGWSFFSGDKAGHLAYNGDETWRLITNDTNEPYSPLELYLMGLISSLEVPDVHILKNPDDTNLQHITAESYKTVTMAEILKIAGGERIPSVNDSQKDFSLAFIVTQDLPYNDAAYAYFSILSRELIGRDPPRKGDMLAPFYWATGGRATLNTYLGDFETLVKGK
jgi:hypothetical protein